MALAVASLWAWRGGNPASAVAAMATGLCAVLMFQPVSFTHYYLPAIVLAAIAPAARRSLRFREVPAPHLAPASGEDPAQPGVAPRRAASSE